MTAKSWGTYLQLLPWSQLPAPSPRGWGSLCVPFLQESKDWTIRTKVPNLISPGHPGGLPWWHKVPRLSLKVSLPLPPSGFYFKKWPRRCIKHPVQNRETMKASSFLLLWKPWFRLWAGYMSRGPAFGVANLSPPWILPWASSMWVTGRGKRPGSQAVLKSRGFAIPRYWMWLTGMSHPDLEDNGLCSPKSEIQTRLTMAGCLMMEAGFLAIHRHFPSFPKSLLPNLKLAILLGKKNGIVFSFIAKLQRYLLVRRGSYFFHKQNSFFCQSELK